MAAMSKHPETDRHTYKCPSCGGDEFVDGDVGPMRISFRPRHLSMFAVGEILQARKCTACGNVQFFAREEQPDEPQA
jgi:hypothetical protein